MRDLLALLPSLQVPLPVDHADASVRRHRRPVFPEGDEPYCEIVSSLLTWSCLLTFRQFIGLYLQQICLAALLFLARAIPQGGCIIALFILTLFYHYLLTNSFGPLVVSLPLTLADKTYGLRKETPATTPAADANHHDPTADAKVAAAQDAEEAPPPEDGQATGVERHELKPRTRRQLTGGTHHSEGAHDDDVGEAETTASVLNEPTTEREPEAPTDFTHPAIAHTQMTVWIPQDLVWDGALSAQEEESIRAHGVLVSSAGAKMNAKGHVDISAAPPDMLDSDNR